MKPFIQLASDRSLLITFGDEISPHLHQDVSRLSALLLSQSIDGVLNIHPAYSSILISFDPHRVSSETLDKKLFELMDRLDSVELPPRQTVTIPVCYDPEFGFDLQDVALLTKLGIDQIIQLHTSAEYLVYFLGFSPGFPYLGGMPPQLTTPRLATPRTKVPAGSVAIGGNQTGIYPIPSPGGWRIIGRTPMKLFDATESPPALLQMGNVVKFHAITRNEFDRILKHQ